MFLGLLTQDESEFLAAIRDGETAKDFARRHNYSEKWAEWTSGKIRSKLGVRTMREAITLSDEVSKADFDALTKLVQSTNEALSDLAKAVTPTEQASAVAQVRERELDEKELAKRLGISLEDVNKIRDENEYAKYKGMQKRLEDEKAAAAAADDDAGDDDDADADEKKGGILDGLGGIRNLAR